MLYLKRGLKKGGETELPLTKAASYVVWLLFSSECIAYHLRKYLYIDSRFQKADVFDDGYDNLLNECRKEMPTDVFGDAEFAVKIRHIFVHKGFPNPHKSPASNNRGGFKETEVWEIRNTIKAPNNYHPIKSRFDAVYSWLGQNEPPFKIEV